LRIEQVEPERLPEKRRAWAMPEQLRAGDVVRLKGGGGPPMTLAYDPEGEAAYLTWFDPQSGAVKTLEASVSALERTGR
jgi:uncharacterized protein YodC (DUF2158 family)